MRTASSNDVVSLALRDGFLVAATFESVAAGTPRTEALWVLCDEVSGMLVTALMFDAIPLDVTLHYNLRTDDPELLRGAPNDYKDPETGTVYVRESVGPNLLSRARALRETGLLVPQWSVSSTIYFLTQTDWEVATGGAVAPDEAARRVALINDERITALPAAVRRQCRLVVRSEHRP